MDDSWLEKIRLRIMQEAYNFADDDNREAYNAIKVMCNDVLNMIQEKRKFVGLTDEEILDEYRQCYGDDGTLTDCYFARAIIIRFKGKNGG